MGSVYLKPLPRTKIISYRKLVNEVSTFGATDVPVYKLENSNVNVMATVDRSQYCERTSVATS